MSTYFSLLTAVGASAMAAGAAAGTPVLLTQIALGDGNGSVPTPTINTTALVNEVHRANINSITQDATNPAWFIVELIIPPATGGFYIREFRIDDALGNAIYVGNCAPEFKPVLADGMTRDSVYRLIVETSNSATINLLVDPNIVTATHDYVDQAINVLDNKKSVRLATTDNTALSGLLTIDGVALVASDRVLVKNQSSALQNGIYTAAVGAWVRSTDADTSAKVTAGLLVIVEEGTINDDTIWLLMTNNPITLNTTSLYFQQVSGKEVPQAEAEAGTATTLRGWSALRVKQAIAALVVQATETVLGKAEIATQAETNAGTDDLRIVTPLKLSSGFAISLTTIGYIKLPTWLGGLIIQWGRESTDVSQSGSRTYPITFSTAVFYLGLQELSIGAQARNVTGNPINLTRFDWYGENTSTGAAENLDLWTWVAIGI